MTTKVKIITSLIATFTGSALFGAGYLFGKKRTEKKPRHHKQRVIGKVARMTIDKDGLRVEADPTMYGADWLARKAEMEQRKEEIANAWANNEEVARRAEEIKEEQGYSDGDVDGDTTVPVGFTNEPGAVEYLSEHESPSEDDDGPDKSNENKSTYNPLFDIHPEDYIIVIDADEFENEQEYDREEITYYEDDDVYCDENDKRLEDADQIFGKDAWTLYGKNPVNPDDVIYIRNTWFEKVFQITRIHNSYGRVVLGLDI